MQPLTLAQLKTLLTNILGGNALDDTLATQLLDMGKDSRESMRDWMILRTEDTSITFTAADTYLSTKTLPDRFLRPYSVDPSESGIFLASGNSKLDLKPIGLAKRFENKDIPGLYYIDYKNGTIGRTGSDAGTLHLNFLQGTDSLETADWTFPAFAHPLLAFDAAIIQKGGIDWDTVNANQVPYNKETIKELERRLAMWDARLQQAELGV